MFLSKALTHCILGLSLIFCCIESVYGASSELIQKTYSFSNPEIVSQILNQLISFKDPNSKALITRKYSVSFNLNKDKDYCKKNLAYFIEDPETLFEDINLVTDMDPRSIARAKATKNVANDIQPEVGMHALRSKNPQYYDLKPNANLFFTRNELQSAKEIGREFSCLPQAYSHIPGHAAICNKDAVAEAANHYIKEFRDRPQCINNDKYFPKTWLLYEKEDCLDFFKAFNSEEYQRLKAKRNIVYIRKVGKGMHMGEGVQPFNDQEEAELKRDYANGELCGEVTKNYLIQNYIHNPLLLNGHKFDFRMYLLVASTNPLIAHYHDGFLRVSLSPYDSTSNDKSVLLTNLALSNDIYKDVKRGNLYNGMDEEGLKFAQQWSFDRLQTYLLDAGIISDPDWLDNYLRPEFKKAMIHLLRFSSKSFFVHSSLYELYGVDFMLDTEMNLWFIEANSAPGLGGYSQPMEKFIVKMLSDHFEVIIGLVRSRMKRVVNYVNQLVDDKLVSLTTNGSVVIQGFEERRAEFQELTKNHYEEEFEVSSENGWKKIIDSNYKGVEMYQGFIEQECL